jgi:CRP-like cAMP-binding protein
LQDRIDLDAIDILELGERYREFLTAITGLMRAWSGGTFVERAVQAAFDNLAWTEEEIMGAYVLRGTPWGERVADQFRAESDEATHLLRAVAAFAGLDESAFARLLSGLHSDHCSPGAVLGREGQRAHRLYVMRVGEVEAWRRGRHERGRGRLVAELHRGDAFGLEALKDGGRYDATYRANVHAQVYWLDADHLAALRPAIEAAQGAGAQVDHLLLLAQMPLFADLGGRALEEVARALRVQTVEPGAIIARQGQARSDLFIILEGEVAAWVAGEHADETLSATMGAGEHFGEYALFADTPYTATYRATQPTTLLLLDEPRFDRLTQTHQTMARYVEQVGTARLRTGQRLLQRRAELS